MEASSGHDFVADKMHPDEDGLRRRKNRFGVKFSKKTDQKAGLLSRDLDRAKRWIRDHARGSERFRLVASSEAQRLKPHAIDIRGDVNPIHLFLNDADDTRSSFYMEDAATEFQVQGL